VERRDDARVDVGKERVKDLARLGEVELRTGALAGSSPSLKHALKDFRSDFETLAVDDEVHSSVEKASCQRLGSDSTLRR
jgi:hypothetical protein